jgi:hypothetical protein
VTKFHREACAARDRGLSSKPPDAPCFFTRPRRKIRPAIVPFVAIGDSAIAGSADVFP